MSQVSLNPNPCMLVSSISAFLVGVMAIHVYRKIKSEEIKKKGVLKACIYASDIVFQLTCSHV